MFGDGDRHSHVLVYHGPLLIHLLGVAIAIYFHYGVTIFIGGFKDFLDFSRRKFGRWFKKIGLAQIFHE